MIIAEKEIDINAALESAHNILINSKKLVIVSHRNPDGDAVGSTLALYHYAWQLGAEAHIIFGDKIPTYLQFLDGISNVLEYNEAEHKKYFLEADSIFLLDLNDLSRLRNMGEAILESNAKKVVIDHHLEPKDFADLYCVDTQSSSTGEIIWKLIRQNHDFFINRSIAEAIYVAIMTDTGNFRFERTDREVFDIIGDLALYGADPVTLYDYVYNTGNINAKHLLGEGLKSLELHYGGRLCLMLINKELYEIHNCTQDDLEGFVEHTLTINGVKAGFLIADVPEDNEVKISFRSKGDFSIRPIAVKFGGGGHKHAAGARIKGLTIDKVREAVLEQSRILFE